MQGTCEDGWRDKRRLRAVTVGHAALAPQKARTRHASCGGAPRGRIVFSRPGFLPYIAFKLLKEARNSLNSLRGKDVSHAVQSQFSHLFPGQGTVTVAYNRLPHW